MKKKYYKKKRKNKYYKYIDIIRVILLISVLLYHLNILNGGYLAVCSFFVLSGYLSIVSLFNKMKINFKEYYVNKFLKLYLPLIIVTFISVSVISLMPNILWLSLKPEVNSIILGYNNFWQIGVNLDYFARHIDSPFMHLWYISILLQFEIIFPLLFILFKKTGDKLNKCIPCIISFILCIISIIYMYSVRDNINIMYYSTFSRIFSLFMGVFIGLIHSYYKVLVPNNKIVRKIIFYLYLFILILMFIFIDSNSYLFISMIIVSFITCRLISYGIMIDNKLNSKFYKVIKSISNISYCVYLVQYPVIYIFQYINIASYLKIIFILILIFGISYILYFCLNYKNKNYKVIRYMLGFILLIISMFGIYKYFITKDYTIELKKLEEQLNANSVMLEDNKKAYELKIKDEKNSWEEKLKELESNESNLGNVVKNLNVVGIGDSVMLGAIDELYNEFPNSYFDAKISRTAWEAGGILDNLLNDNMLGDTIIFNLGTNGDCSYECKVNIINKCGNREIFWLNTVNYSYVNDNLNYLASNYSNLHIIDWNSISNGHSEYFGVDGIHLTNVGKKAFANTIYESIYNAYLDKYNKEKEEVINKHNDKLKNKYSFYGNDLLINSYEDIKDKYSDAEYNINKNYNYEMLYNDISNSINNDTLNYNVVFAFDKTINLSYENYVFLINLCKDYNIYILLFDNKYDFSDYNNVNVIMFDLYDEYLMVDRVHLNSEGNKKLVEVIDNCIKKKD